MALDRESEVHDRSSEGQTAAVFAAGFTGRARAKNSSWELRMAKKELRKKHF